MATRLHLTYRDRVARVRARTTRLALAAPSDDIGEWLAAVVPLVLDGQRTVVAETDAYLSLEAGLATGTSTDPWGIDAERLIGAAARRGTLLEDVYGRNLHSDAGTLAARVTREVATDMQLAARSAAWIHTTADPRIVGYRRTLGTGPNCGLCIAASTRRYGREDLQPIHAHCGCSVEPIYGTAPADMVIDRARLEDLYNQVGSTSAAQLSRYRSSDLPATVDPSRVPEVTVVDTPELGPTLTAA